MLIRSLPRIRIPLLVIYTLAFSFLLLPTHTHADKISEEQIKAVFLFNFAGFIRWPDDAFSDANAPFHFCALTDQTPIIQALNSVITGESINGRSLVFRLIDPIDELNMDEIYTCQILFLHKQELSQFTTLTQTLAGSPILTVSDDDDFTRKGGMIALTRTVRRLRPIINNKRLQQAGLKASSKLLQLAKITE